MGIFCEWGIFYYALRSAGASSWLFTSPLSSAVKVVRLHMRRLQSCQPNLDSAPQIVVNRISFQASAVQLQILTPIKRFERNSVEEKINCHVRLAVASRLSVTPGLFNDDGIIKMSESSKNKE
jgi:hypothetical protein